MTDTGSVQARRYHHGDLSRALIDAARRIIEAEGPAALSLRAVAREAGVSPAAPYHHFKDKCELTEAVAHEGWMALDEAMSQARRQADNPQDALKDIGVAYVTFARKNPALYRLMYDGARSRESLTTHGKEEDSGFRQVADAIVAARGELPDNEMDLKLATVASWCAVHGIAEMVAMKQFEPLRQSLGGEEALIRALLDHIGISRHHRRPAMA